MKKILIAAVGFCMATVSTAQQTEGKVVYERTMQMQMQFSGMNDEMQRMIPRTRIDKFELTFGNNKSLWKQAEQEAADETEIGGGGMQIRIMAQGTDDVVYCNFDENKRVDQRVLFDKKFIVEDSIRSLTWKLGEETKTILGQLCRKASTTRYSTRMSMTMENGKMERREVQDTSLIVAWFTSNIPVSAGPAEFQGQLPGLILEMDINDGRQLYKALEISPKTNLASIKEPSGKKRYTPEEFNAERNKMLEEMQRNNQGGGNRVFRMN
jgi:GLPGLI family protein